MKVWNERLGHLNHDYDNQLSKKNLVTVVEVSEAFLLRRIVNLVSLGKIINSVFLKRVRIEQLNQLSLYTLTMWSNAG